MIEFAARVQGAGWTVLAVATDAKPEAARAALPRGQKLPDNFRVVFDPQSKAAEAFGSFVFPETYWVDEGGAIRHKWVGPQDWARIAESGFLKAASAAGTGQK
jgi:peroxiredoxin